jgi:hypothetical protein
MRTQAIQHGSRERLASGMLHIERQAQYFSTLAEGAFGAWTRFTRSESTVAKNMRQLESWWSASCPAAVGERRAIKPTRFTVMNNPNSIANCNELAHARG